MTGLIIPDVHEKIDLLNQYLVIYDAVDWVIFLGDFMDRWGGLPKHTYQTGQWLRENILNPKYTFIFGNHDIQYAWPINGHICGGYTEEKQRIMRQFVGRSRWNKFKLLHWINVGGKPWLLSHAGVHPSLLHPIKGFEPSSLADQEKRALHRLTIGEIDPFIQIGQGRGGPAPVGGVDWLDWNTEFVPIDGLNQIVGHTHDLMVRWNNTVSSTNICMDTGMNHVMLVDDDEMAIVDRTGFRLSNKAFESEGVGSTC